MNREQALNALIARSGGAHARHVYERLIDLATFMPGVVVSMGTSTPLNILWDNSEYTLPPQAQAGLQIQVAEGEVLVDSVEMILDTAEVLVFEVHTSSSSEGLVRPWQTSQAAGIEMYRGHEGNIPSESATPTRVTLPARFATWRIFTSSTSYATRVCAYNGRLNRQLVWPERRDYA